VHGLTYIFCYPERCTGCRACELACSGAHEGFFSPSNARIRAIREEPAIDIAITCRQCAKPPCAAACPTAAIQKRRDGLVEVISSRCIGCGACAEACPFGAIHVFRDIAIKCDLCGGDPECVKACAPYALKLMTSEQVADEKRREHAAVVMRPTLRKLGVK